MRMTLKDIDTFGHCDWIICEGRRLQSHNREPRSEHFRIEDVVGVKIVKAIYEENKIIILDAIDKGVTHFVTNNQEIHDYIVAADTKSLFTVL